MSRYTQAWEQLKKNHVCVLAVPLPLQKRVIKAIIRTKDEDLAFKLQAAEEHKSYKITYIVESARITFKLRCTLKLTALLGE